MVRLPHFDSYSMYGGFNVLHISVISVIILQTYLKFILCHALVHLFSTFGASLGRSSLFDISLSIMAIIGGGQGGGSSSCKFYLSSRMAGFTPWNFSTRYVFQ